MSRNNIFNFIVFLFIGVLIDWLCTVDIVERFCFWLALLPQCIDGFDVEKNKQFSRKSFAVFTSFEGTYALYNITITNASEFALFNTSLKV